MISEINHKPTLDRNIELQQPKFWYLNQWKESLFCQTILTGQVQIPKGIDTSSLGEPLVETILKESHLNHWYTQATTIQNMMPENIRTETSITKH